MRDHRPFFGGDPKPSVSSSHRARFFVFFFHPSCPRFPCARRSFPRTVRRKIHHDLSASDGGRTADDCIEIAIEMSEYDESTQQAQGCCPLCTLHVLQSPVDLFLELVYNTRQTNITIC